MIRSNVNKISKWDSFCVLPGHEDDINKALVKGCKNIIVDNTQNNLYTKVKNTRSFLNNYLRQYDNILKNIKIIGVMDNTLSYTLYNVLNKLNIKTSYIGESGYYKNKKIHGISNMEADDLYEMLLDSYQENYKYVVIELHDYLIEKDVLANIKFDIILVNKVYNKDVKYIDFSMRLLFEKISKKGSIIINGDNAYIGYMGFKKMITYGFINNDYKISKYTLTKEKMSFKYVYKNKYYSVITKLFGIDNMYMAMALIITLSKMKVSNKEINNVFSTLSIPYNYEVFKYEKSYVMTHKLDIKNDIKNLSKNIKLYSYNHIYVIVNSEDNYIISEILKFTEYIIIVDSNDDINMLLKRVMKKVTNNDLLLILEVGENTKNYLYA